MEDVSLYRRQNGNYELQIWARIGNSDRHCFKYNVEADALEQSTWPMFMTANVCTTNLEPLIAKELTTQMMPDVEAGFLKIIDRSWEERGKFKEFSGENFNLHLGYFQDGDQHWCAHFRGTLITSSGAHNANETAIITHPGQSVTEEMTDMLLAEWGISILNQCRDQILGELRKKRKAFLPPNKKAPPGWRAPGSREYNEKAEKEMSAHRERVAREIERLQQQQREQDDEQKANWKESWENMKKGLGL